MSDPIVSLKDVNMTFNAGPPKETVALKGINLDIQPGEFISLIGPSGCGKCTLMRLVGDLLQPTSRHNQGEWQACRTSPR